MEEKVAEGIRQKLKACDAQLEQLRSSLARKQLLLARLAHNWSCPSPAPVASPAGALREPILVPVTAPGTVFAQHEVLAVGGVPEDCGNFAKVELHERRFHERWVLVVEVEKSPELVVEGLLPVSDGSDAEQVSWTVAVVASAERRTVLVAARPLPAFCGTEAAARVTLSLRCADDRYLPCGTTELSWRQLLENRLPAVPDTQAEFEALPEKERRVAQFVLDGLQCRLPLLVGRRSLEAQLESGSETSWLRDGPLACRLRVMQREEEEEAEEEEAEGVRVELRASDARSAALASRLLLLRPPSPRPGLREMRWLRRRFRRLSAALFSLLAAEVAAWCGEAGGSSLRGLRGASLSELAAALSEARAQRASRGPLPRAVRERLRNGARAAREAERL